MHTDNRLILYSAKIHPSPAEFERLNQCMEEVIDWKLLTDKIVHSNMGPMLYTKIPQLPNSKLIPVESMKHLRQSYFQTLSRGSLMYQLLRKTILILRENEIEAIVLKGAYLAEALPKKP